MSFPKQIPFLIIGAGVHGLSTAWHLARELRARNRGSGQDIIVVDKDSIASGASGIACGVVRNFYYQPAMGEVMRVSVEIWESDPRAFHYHPVGYLAVAQQSQAADVETIFERHQKSGYRRRWCAASRRSTIICGASFPTGRRVVLLCACTSTRAALRSIRLPCWVWQTKPKRKACVSFPAQK